MMILRGLSRVFLLSLLYWISFVDDCNGWLYFHSKVTRALDLNSVSSAKEYVGQSETLLRDPSKEEIKIAGEKTRPIKLNYQCSIDRLGGLQLVLNSLLFSKQKRYTDKDLQIRSIIEVCEKLFASGVYEQIILLFHLFLNHDNYRHLETSTVASSKSIKGTQTKDNLLKLPNEKYNHRYALFSDRLDRLSTELTSSPEFLIVLIRSFIAMDDVDTAIQLLQLYSNKGILFSAESKSLLITQLAESSVVGLQAALKIRTSMLNKKQPLTLQASISLLNGLYEFTMKRVTLKEDFAEKEGKVTEDKLIINMGVVNAQQLFKKLSTNLELSPIQVMELATEIFQGAFLSNNSTLSPFVNSTMKSEQRNEIISSTEDQSPLTRTPNDKKKKQQLVHSFVRILFRYSIYSVEQSFEQEQESGLTESSLTEHQRTLQLMKDAAYYSEIDETFLSEVEILTNQISQKQQEEEKSSKSPSVEVMREEGVVRGIAVSLIFLSEIRYKLDLKVMEVLIEECLFENEILGVKYLFAMMKKLKIYSKTKTFHLLLKVYQSKVRSCDTEDEKMKAVNQMVLIVQELMKASNHTKPNIQTYEILLTPIMEAVDKTSQPANSLELCRLAESLMEELRCHPQYQNSFYWTKNIFHSQLKMKLMMRSPYIPVLQEMIASSVQPDYSTMNLIYDGLAQQNDSRQLIELYALQMKGEISRRKVTSSYLEAVRMRYYKVLPEDQIIFQYIKDSSSDSESQKTPISAKQIQLYLPSLTSDNVVIIMKHLIALGKVSDAYDVFQHFLKFSKDQVLPQVPYVDASTFPSSDAPLSSSSQAVEMKPILGFERYAQQPSAEMFAVLLEGLMTARSKAALNDLMAGKYDECIEELRRLLVEWELTPTKQWFHLLMINDGMKAISLLPVIEHLNSMKRYYVPTYETLNCLFYTFYLIRSKFEKVLTLQSPLSPAASSFPDVGNATQVARTAAQNYLTNQLRVLASCIQQIDDDPRYDLSSFSQEYLFQVFPSSFTIGKLLKQMENAGFYSSYGPEPKSGVKSAAPVISVSLNVINALLQGLMYEPSHETISSGKKLQILLNRRKEVKSLLLTLGESGIVPDDDVMDYFDISGMEEEEEEVEYEENDDEDDANDDLDRDRRKTETTISLFDKEYDDYREIVDKKKFDPFILSDSESLLSTEKSSLHEENHQDSLRSYVKLFEQSVYHPLNKSNSTINEGRSFYDEYQLIIDEEKDLFQGIFFNQSTSSFPSPLSMKDLFEPEKEKQIIFREAVKATEKRFRQIEDRLSEGGSGNPRQTKSVLAHLMNESHRERIIPYLSEIRQRLILQMCDKKHKYKSWKHYRQALDDRQFVASNSKNLPLLSKEEQLDQDELERTANVSEKREQRRNYSSEKNKKNMSKELSSEKGSQRKPRQVLTNEEFRLSSKRSWNKQFFTNPKRGNSRSNPSNE